MCEERGVAIYMCCAGSMIAVCCARRGVVLVGDVVLTRRMVHTAVRNDCRGMELKAVKPVRSFQVSALRGEIKCNSGRDCTRLLVGRI